MCRMTHRKQIDMMYELYDYFRSTASYRVRIALAYKQCDYKTIPIHLINNGGEQHQSQYLELNPQGLVPTLKADNHYLHQSLAILEYLEECHPEPRLLPKDPIVRAEIRAVAQSIACDIHPLNNLRVLQYLQQKLNVSEDEKNTWYHHWVHKGLSALETQLAQHPARGLCCFGDTPTFADLCLIPQMFNAHRFEVPLDDYPTLVAIEAHCLTLPAFIAAAPR